MHLKDMALCKSTETLSLLLSTMPEKLCIRGPIRREPVLSVSTFEDLYRSTLWGPEVEVTFSYLWRELCVTLCIGAQDKESAGGVGGPPCGAGGGLRQPGRAGLEGGVLPPLGHF
eukprot:TRINITY_DN22411_c0_g2_i1.p1 TRINITY_DN22411_c0_g2~~TRINITY_DN22411_c0_g2_i1.p1  ORF type:complete len:115 (+),score=11.89 TRINITY_DN22411_c0_g2_i1:43-387(+)